MFDAMFGRAVYRQRVCGLEHLWLLSAQSVYADVSLALDTVLLNACGSRISYANSVHSDRSQQL